VQKLRNLWGPFSGTLDGEPLSGVPLYFGRALLFSLPGKKWTLFRRFMSYRPSPKGKKIAAPASRGLSIKTQATAAERVQEIAARLLP